jgi:GNAT superfamily N-acetyltransferase
MNAHVAIREMAESDCPIIAAAFEAQGWNKPLSQYRSYWEESLARKRTVLLAHHDGVFAGYLTVVWESHYPPFRLARIPEIADFNVLLKYRRLRVGTALMDTAEALVARRSPIVGLGVGLDSDYGAAQVLYAKRGYVPDGRGLYHQGRHPSYGEQVEVGDDLVLYLTKEVPVE